MKGASREWNGHELFLPDQKKLRAPLSLLSAAGGVGATLVHEKEFCSQ